MTQRISNQDIAPVNARQMEALRKASPGVGDIFQNIDAYNEEINEQVAATGSRQAEAPQSDPRTLKPASKETIEAIKSMKPLFDAHEEIKAESEAERLDRLLAEQQARKAAEAAAAPKKEEPEEPARSPEEQRMDSIKQMLFDAPGAPSPAQIDALKRQRGSLHVMALGKGDVYIFSPLLRQQLLNIQAMNQKQSQLEGMAKDPQEYMTEQVIKQCVVWPKLDERFWYMSKSGVIPTLYDQIMLNSYHLSTQQAMYLTTEL